MATSDLLNTAEAAARLGVTPGRVRQFLQGDHPRLKGLKIGGRDWLIEASELRRFASLNRPTGNPGFQKSGK